MITKDLSAINFNMLSIGQLVRSKTTGVLGAISELDPKGDDVTRDDNRLSINWMNSRQSLQLEHYQCTEIGLVYPEDNRPRQQTPEELWERFIAHLEKVDPVPGGTHQSFIGSVVKYKQIFLEANS